MSRISLLFLSVVLFFFSACAENEEKFINVLPGEWEVYSFKVDEKSKDERAVQLAKKLAKSVRYKFYDDFTYTIYSLSYPEGRNGKWSYLPQKKNLHLKIDEEVQEIAISRYDDRSMAFITSSGKFGEVQTLLRKTR